MLVPLFLYLFFHFYVTLPVSLMTQLLVPKRMGNSCVAQVEAWSVYVQYLLSS